MPFILIARIKAKEGKENDYFHLAKNTDEAVRESGSGMIHRAFDTDTENPLCFAWSELYQNDAVFLARLNNRPVAEYLTLHAELAEDFSVEVCGTVGNELGEEMISTGLPIKIYETKCGYSRL